MNKYYFFIIAWIVAATCLVQIKAAEIEPEKQELKQNDYSLKRKVAISPFSNETEYGKEIPYDKEKDPVGKKAMNILSAKLTSTGRFIVSERLDMDRLIEDLKTPGNNVPQETGAEYLIIGSITEFGSKKEGNMNTSLKAKMAEATVRISIVDVLSGDVIYSGETNGESESENYTAARPGENNNYDPSLLEKVISDAISKLEENIINNCINRPWKTFIVNYDLNGIVIAGGESQGLKIEEILELVEKSKSAHPTQTVEKTELPGKVVGKIQIICFGGDTNETEYALASLIEGSFDVEKLGNYYIRKIK
jgi:curli biogenesis system outer membrane secretion channel CsgG